MGKPTNLTCNFENRAFFGYAPIGQKLEQLPALLVARGQQDFCEQKSNTCSSLLKKNYVCHCIAS